MPQILEPEPPYTGDPVPPGPDATPEQIINYAYQVALGREADPIGLRDRAVELKNGMTLDQMIAGLRQSPEGQARSATPGARGTPPPGAGLPGLEPEQFENPQAIVGFLRSGLNYELPDRATSGAGLRRLQMAGASGLEGLLDTTAGDLRRRAIEEALFERSSEDIGRAYTDTRQGIREENFGRGIGLSTITGDDLGRLERERNDALSRARREAFVTAGGESRADDAARLAAVGQAFNSGTTGLQGEANVGLANAGREQAARTSAAQFGFSNLLNRLNREQQERLTREGYQNTADIAASNRIASGVGAGLGGLASFFGPAINRASTAASRRLVEAF